MTGNSGRFWSALTRTRTEPISYLPSASHRISSYCNKRNTVGLAETYGPSWMERHWSNAGIIRPGFWCSGPARSLGIPLLTTSACDTHVVARRDLVPFHVLMMGCFCLTAGLADDPRAVAQAKGLKGKYPSVEIAKDKEIRTENVSATPLPDLADYTILQLTIHITGAASLSIVPVQDRVDSIAR